MAKKQTVLITGASSGIGKATAKYFQAKGWNVAATMRSPEKEKELSKLENVLCIRLDVTEPQSIQAAKEETLRRFKSIDVVVNNAGYGLVGPFEAISQQKIEKQIATNLFGVMELTRAIIPYFRENKKGVIINVTSIGGRITLPLCSPYHASKWAVEGFSESLQHELRPMNIKIKIVEPGPIKTDFYDRSLDMVKPNTINAYDTYIERAITNMQKDMNGRGKPPAEVAKTIYRAATDGNWKLRYPVVSMGILALRRFLPDSLFNITIRAVVLR